MSEMKNERCDLLFDAILSLKTREECYKFFEDICTVQELQEMSKRILGATLLDSGMVYTDIVKKTGLSTATISRINRCLSYGSGGYRLALDRLGKSEESEEE
ncbi:MAG: hypothetical protein IJF55_01085 [Clostridia bacterium]|jgi:TrpR-related protein YerC/YecD|nr:hypothetical protein [Clostridia bacterium]